MEVAVATVLLVVAIVPALRILRDSMTVSREIETRGLLTNYCASKLEEYLALTAASWQTTTASGTLSADGYPQLRFQVVRSDAPASGGITNRLMAVTATVWDDADSSGTLSTGERSVTLASKIAKMAIYEQQAGS